MTSTTQIDMELIKARFVEMYGSQYTLVDWVKV
jgi:hypothetical protein